MSELCLITGASGFIGGRLASRLRDHGSPVRCLVRASSDASLLQELGVEIAVGDLTDARSLAGALNGCGCVVHCGALVSDWATVAEIAAVNVAGTRAAPESRGGCRRAALRAPEHDGRLRIPAG